LVWGRVVIFPLRARPLVIFRNSTRVLVFFAIPVIFFVYSPYGQFLEVVWCAARSSSFSFKYTDSPIARDVFALRFLVQGTSVLISPNSLVLSVFFLTYLDVSRSEFFIRGYSPRANLASPILVSGPQRFSFFFPLFPTLQSAFSLVPAARAFRSFLSLVARVPPPSVSG